jgi:hypothetical protein
MVRDGEVLFSHSDVLDTSKPWPKDSFHLEEYILLGLQVLCESVNHALSPKAPCLKRATTDILAKWSPDFNH